ncbi:MAG: alpha/beta hydrolase [Pseudomonadota bacterium]|nr:alpha/beta hydrolase [Pseudomonadota bacterium]
MALNKPSVKIEFVPDSPNIAYKIAGQGDPVIFLHGIGGNKDNWVRQIEFFSRSNTVIAWDARGYGDSEDYLGPLDFRAFSHDIRRLLDHLDIKKAHLCGLSMGGRIILDFYELHKERVSSLTLVDTFPGFDNSFTEEGRERFIQERRQPLVEGGKEPADIAPSVVPGIVSPSASKAVVNELIQSMSKLHKDSYVKTIESMTMYKPVADVSQILVPVQIIVGEEDKLTPPSVSQNMHEKIADSRLEIISNAGHITNIEAPERFNNCLRNFLEEVSL